MRRQTPRILALLLVGAYAGVALLGAICLFGGSTEATASHHHAGQPGKTAHSPLCAWACQAGSSALAFAADTSGPRTLLLFILLVFLVSARSICFVSSQRTRAPPSFSF